MREHLHKRVEDSARTKATNRCDEREAAQKKLGTDRNTKSQYELASSAQVKRVHPVCMTCFASSTHDVCEQRLELTNAGSLNYILRQIIIYTTHAKN